jgi:hypothetical protein
MLSITPTEVAPAGRCPGTARVPVSADWLRLASPVSERRAQQLVAVSAANTLWGAWWLYGVVALGIAGWAVIEGRRAVGLDQADQQPADLR